MTDERAAKPKPTKRPAQRPAGKQATTPSTKPTAPAKKATKRAVPVKRATKRTIKRTATIDIRVAVRQWLLADDALINFSAQKDQQRLVILDHLAEFGDTDSNGHQWLRFYDDPIEGRVKAIKREKRKRVTPNAERIEEYLRAHGLWEQCTETIVIIDEAKFLELNWPDPVTGVPVISDKDFEALHDVSETWAFVPQRVKL